MSINGTPVNANAMLYLLPVTATLKVIAPLGAAEVYGLGGAGVYLGYMSVEAASSFARASDSDTSFGTGVHLGAGTVINVSPRVSVNAELRYHVANAKFFDANGRIDNVQVTGGFAFKL